MSRILFFCFAFLVVHVVVDGGRLVQEDPYRRNKFQQKSLVQEAPDDYFKHRKLNRPLVSSTTPLLDLTSTIKPAIAFPSSPLPTPPRKYTHFTTTGTPVKGPYHSRRQNMLAKVAKHRLMAGKNARSALSGSTEIKELFGGLEDLEIDEDVRRYKRQGSLIWTTHPPHNLDLDRFFLTIATEVYPYGTCIVSMGYDDNPKCASGQVCVNKDSGQKIECSEPSGTCTDCAPPANPPPPPVAASPPCPAGCKPGKFCILESHHTDENGLCVDPKREDAEYDLSLELSSTKRTPMIFFPGTLGKGADCTVYGDLIDETQKSDLDLLEKGKKLKDGSDSDNLGSAICNWAHARLQCIPKEPRSSTTTLAGAQLTEADITASKRLPGTCQCMLALGERAAELEDEETGQTICYIPANKGTNSNCDHTIYPPYGAIDGVRIKDGAPFTRFREPAAKFCVPNSECRPGFKYTGLRCQCKKKARWDPKTFSCSRATNLIKSKEGMDARVLVIIMAAFYRKPF